MHKGTLYTNTQQHRQQGCTLAKMQSVERTFIKVSIKGSCFWLFWHQQHPYVATHQKHQNGVTWSDRLRELRKGQKKYTHTHTNQSSETGPDAHTTISKNIQLILVLLFSLFMSSVSVWAVGTSV